MGKRDQYEAKVAAIPANAACNETQVVLAFLLAGKDGEIGFHWLPELFSKPLPPSVKEEIVALLRFHAEMLESGETEKRMWTFTGINNPQNREQ